MDTGVELYCELTLEKQRIKGEQSCYRLYFFSDTTKMFFGQTPTQGVFWGRAVTHYGKRYNLNYENAKRFCHLLGAPLATYNQPYAAWQAGLERCS